MGKKRLALLAALALAVTSITVVQSVAAPQKFTFKVMGQCADSAMEGTIEEDVTGSCYVMVTVNPVKPFRTFNLQYKDDKGKWQFANDDYNEKISVKGGSSKQVQIYFPSYDEDGAFFDFEKREYRVYIGKVGSAPGVASKTIIINYVAAGAEGDDVEEVEP